MPLLGFVSQVHIVPLHLGYLVHQIQDPLIYYIFYKLAEIIDEKSKYGQNTGKEENKLSNQLQATNSLRNTVTFGKIRKRFNLICIMLDIS